MDKLTEMGNRLFSIAPNITIQDVVRPVVAEGAQAVAEALAALTVLRLQAALTECQFGVLYTAMATLRHAQERTDFAVRLLAPIEEG